MRTLRGDAVTAEQRLAAILALLRARVASGDVRACVLRDVEALAKSSPES